MWLMLALIASVVQVSQLKLWWFSTITQFFDFSIFVAHDYQNVYEKQDLERLLQPMLAYMIVILVVLKICDPRNAYLQCPRSLPLKFEMSLS